MKGKNVHRFTVGSDAKISKVTLYQHTDGKLYRTKRNAEDSMFRDPTSWEAHVLFPHLLADKREDLLKAIERIKEMQAKLAPKISALFLELASLQVCIGTERHQKTTYLYINHYSKELHAQVRKLRAQIFKVKL